MEMWLHIMQFGRILPDCRYTSARKHGIESETIMHLRTLIFSAFLTLGSWAALADDPDPKANHTPEFGGQCAMSAAVGAHRPTSCTVVWISPEDKLYCFSNEQAKQAFMRDAPGNERKAQAFFKDPDLFERLKKAQPEG